MRKRISLITMALLAMSYVASADLLALAAPPPSDPVVNAPDGIFWNPFQALITAEPVVTPKKRKNKSAAAKIEKPEQKSPFSLEGQVFNRIGNDTRLAGNDAARYTSIFAFQDAGNFGKANEVISKLDDHRLMGHVLFHRYLALGYKATYRELADWMKSYADHPKAQAIYDIAKKRKSQKGVVLVAARPGRGISGYHDYDSGQLAQPSMTGQKQDILQARAAESYFYNGKVSEAYEAAAASSERSGKEVPLAGWIAGLSAWKQGRYDEAAKHFEKTANSPRASAWMMSAGAHWAARSYLRSRHPEKVNYWLRRAAEYPRSFYGIISVKALGMEHARFNWNMPELSNRLVKALANVPAGKRALALVDAGRLDLAGQELRRINPGNDGTMQEAMMALAHEAGIPAFQMRLGSSMRDAKGSLYDAALYPDIPWQPQGGYQVDRALVHAFIRQESKFDADANNKSSGATGLMQLMPATAMNVARQNGIKVSREQLRDPVVNMGLGQKYLADLLQSADVQGNLFKLAVAYNAGPGKLARWEKSIKYEDDPLLFIESIPVSETRIFVERVLTNYWIYSLKYNQGLESLEKVASGEWPAYVTADTHRLFSLTEASIFSKQ